jgi:hypothetical protein
MAELGARNLAFKFPRSKQALIEALQEEWGKIDMEKVRNLCLSMPRRLQAVIDVKGGSTKY